MRIALSILIITFLLAGCDTDQEVVSMSVSNSLETKRDLVYQNDQSLTDDSKLEFSIVDANSVIQTIEKFRENIVYRITKVDTKTHLLRQGNLDDEQIIKALKELKNEQLFYVEFEESSKQDLLQKEFEGASYSSAIKYLTNQIKADFIVIHERDTIEPSFVNYERNFHVAPFERLLLGFSKVQPNSSMELLYKDQLFGNGLLKFSFLSNSNIINNSDFVL